MLYYDLRSIVTIQLMATLTLLPTSFSLLAERVDDLIELILAGRMLFCTLLRELFVKTLDLGELGSFSSSP